MIMQVPRGHAEEEGEKSKHRANLLVMLEVSDRGVRELAWVFLHQKVQVAGGGVH